MQPDDSKVPRVSRESFGILADGTLVELLKLRGDYGFEVRLITYGATLQSIFVPDRAGCLADVVLGCDDLDAYVAVRRFFGATIGRYANRIEKAKFELDGHPFELVANDGANALHGGPAGFDRKCWLIAGIGEDPVPFVKLTYVSPDGEEGYPGCLECSITYSITGGTELSVAWSAETDKPTIVNLTNHSFFNLAGVEIGGDILDHNVTIGADFYLPVDEGGIPLSAPSPVVATPFDFRDGHRVGARLHDDDAQLQSRQGYDHNFCVGEGSLDEAQLVARVEDPRSGRILELLTNQPGVQFYSGNFLDGTTTGKYGRVYHQYDALCLEPQAYPNAPNRPDYPSARLDPGRNYCHRTRYRFSAR
jgi:aldose 1-epimerase